MKTSLFFIFFFLTSLGAQEYEVIQAERPVLLQAERYFNRFMINENLIRIFGEKSKKYIYDGIFSRPWIFSGPCDVYEQIRTSETGVQDPYTSCFERNDNSILPLFGSPNILRSGYMVKTCLNLVGDESILESLLKKNPTVKQIYRQFYPFKNLEPEVAKALGKVKEKHGNKWLVHTLCIDPGWKSI